MLHSIFDYFSPFAQVSPDNPIFRFESRAVKRGTPESLWRSTIKVAGITLLLICGLWVAALFFTFDSTNYFTNTNSLDYSSYYDTLLLQAWFFLAGLGFCDKFILDFFGMWVGLHSFNADVVSKRWDVLRLTPIKAEALIDSRIALAQIQAWRPFIFIVTFRFGVLVWGILTLFVPPLLFQSWPWRGSLHDIIDQFFRDPLSVIVPLLIAILFFAYYLIEPYWRLKMITASSVAVGTKMRSLYASVLWGLWHLVIVWFFQIMIVIASMLLMNFMFNFSSATAVFVAIMAIIWMLVVALITYFIYRSRERVWYMQAWRVVAAELINVPEFR